MAEYNERLEDLLDHHLIANEELKKKRELGGVGYLINGNMCLGVFESLLLARIGEQLASALIDKPGVELYLPHKDEFNDIITIEESVYSHSKILRKFIEQSIEYTKQLPPKEHPQEDSH